MELLINILGWVGSIEVVTAYALNSSQKIKSDSITFQSLNLTGAIFLIINSLYKEAYPFTFINTVWAVIAVVAIVGIIRKK
ncbi:MAG TPA: hypothetical protein PKJ83_14710 [Cyclobacteriaceae bacterium]|nr:hypothetical protein [Cyclobacteriaceae bacterium]HPW60644.1 hypothetical protein [Cyclobacteriaceae bacterium]HRG78523.1 hypothetical protein [Cyclobacteriaceae bacterium]